jgi:hypothetical protein
MNIEETGAEIINTIYEAMKEKRHLSNDEHVHLDRLIKQIEDEI